MIKLYFSLMVILFFSNGPRSPPDCIIIDNRVFDDLILNDELFAKALARFATYLLVNSNSCGKLDSELELSLIFDDNLKTTSFLRQPYSITHLQYFYNSFW